MVPMTIFFSLCFGIGPRGSVDAYIGTIAPYASTQLLSIFPSTISSFLILKSAQTSFYSTGITRTIGTQYILFPEMLRMIPSLTLKNILIFLSTMAASALDLTEMTSPLDLLKQLSAQFLLMQVLFFFGPPCGTFACLHSPLLHFTLDLFLPRYPSRSVLDLGSSSDIVLHFYFKHNICKLLAAEYLLTFTQSILVLSCF